MRILITFSNLFCCIYIISRCADGTGPPTVDYYIRDVWKNISTERGIIFYDDLGDYFGVACEAPYPIKWNISGIITPAEIVKIEPPRRNVVKQTFSIHLFLSFWKVREYSELTISADIVCENFDDPRIQKKMSLFVKGVSNKPILQARETTVINSKLIPCFTTDPINATHLFLLHPNGTEQLIQNVVYNPTEGFYSTEVFNGQYICRQGSHHVKISALPQSDEFSPQSDSVIAFSEETITFKCSSTTKPVQFRYETNKNVTVSIVTLSANSKEAIVSSVFMDSESMEANKGKIACIHKDNSTQQRIKDWNYEFLATPELFLNNVDGESQCISGSVPRSVQTVRCQNSMDCQFMSRCFANVTDCNFGIQNQFFVTTPEFCYIPFTAYTKVVKYCAKLPYAHYNGMVQCAVKGGLTKRWEFFVSLDFLKYSNWRDAPLRELVRMDETPRILYTNTSSRFHCSAVAYLFANSLTFKLENANGSRYILENNGDTINVTSRIYNDPRKIEDFNVLRQLDILLPIDAVKVYCIAPWWNSTEVLLTEREFETRHLKFPTIHNGLEDAKQTFYTKEKNRRLTCAAQGEPQPVYKWLYNRDGLKNAIDLFPELQTSMESSGEGYLEFPTAGAKHSGEYLCIAENQNGRVEKKFILEVTDEPVSGKSVAYIIGILIFLVIFFIVLGSLLVFMRRYKKAKELVRSLTDNEIDEFFHGKPELLTNSGYQPTTENIDFLPYKMEYEISVDDLEFDQSEKNFLGSGKFSCVVKGKIISKSLPVAVKISKPSADVDLFKSLLSEVKIMIYIGGHDNVVKLIGVCTEGIRSRNINIATEICELGSLDKYILKARPTFVNLMDANQKLDISLLPNGTDQVSTLNLISFAAQIAKGMEYLSSKSVIHADLASRNVLLTSQKVCKISDFGLSRKLYECNNYVKKTKSPLPWRWMPQESLNTLTFSSQSDVWSYGATLYELFTLGDIPFPNEEWNKEFMERLMNGMRMGRPKYSTAEIYSKIVDCWEHEPEHRPSFSSLRSYYENMLAGYGVLPSETVDESPAETNLASNSPLPVMPIMENPEHESLYEICEEIDSSLLAN